MDRDHAPPYAQDRPEAYAPHVPLTPEEQLALQQWLNDPARCRLERALPPERLIRTPPGGMRLDEREVGFRHAIAIAWRAIQHAITADECRLRIVELGQGPAPDLSGPPRP